MDGEMENGRHKVFIFAKSFGPKISRFLFEKLNDVMDCLKCAVNFNAVFGLVLKNVEDRIVGFIVQTKILHYWTDLNLWLLQKSWRKSRNYYVTPL